MSGKKDARVHTSFAFDMKRAADHLIPSSTDADVPGPPPEKRARAIQCHDIPLRYDGVDYILRYYQLLGKCVFQMIRHDSTLNKEYEHPQVRPFVVSIDETTKSIQGMRIEEYASIILAFVNDNGRRPGTSLEAALVILLRTTTIERLTARDLPTRFDVTQSVQWCLALQRATDYHQVEMRRLNEAHAEALARLKK